jgi:hypothetical protein
MLNYINRHDGIYGEKRRYYIDHSENNVARSLQKRGLIEILYYGECRSNGTPILQVMAT